MRCPNCQQEIPDTARVCGYCGCQLSAAIRCPHCGADLPAQARVCGHCGQPLGVPPAAAHAAGLPGWALAVGGVLIGLVVVLAVAMVVLMGLPSRTEPTPPAGVAWRTPRPTVIAPPASTPTPTSTLTETPTPVFTPTPTETSTSTPTPTSTLTPTPTPTSAPSEITIGVDNRDCRSFNVVLDGQTVLSIGPEQTASFALRPAMHTIVACDAVTKDCSNFDRGTLRAVLPLENGAPADGVVNGPGDFGKEPWDQAATVIIERIPVCPVNGQVTMRLINENCWAIDFYVDGVMVASVAAESSTTFTAGAGNHTTQVCNTGTRDCSAEMQETWMMSARKRVSRHESCP